MYQWPQRKNNRLIWYNYSSVWWYFITFCTKNRIKYLSEIIDWKIILNNYWRIVEKEILNTWLIRNNIEIDEYVIMPDHIHLIIFVGNDCIVPDINSENEPMQVIPTIIKWIKSTITKQINEIQSEFEFWWQKSYYDRIIRNENELNTIRQYIIDNPLKWEWEKDKMENLYM